MKFHNSGIVAAAALSIALASCAGGGTNGAVPSAPTQPANSAQPVSATLVIRIPSSTSASSVRRPMFVSPGTQSLSVIETDGTSTPSPAVTVNVSSCPTVSGAVTCSVVVPARPGADTFAVTAFDQPNGVGNALSTGTLAATIVSGVANTTLPLVLGGVVNSISITPALPTLPLGQSTTAVVSAKDASGATIIGTYDNPISLSGPNLAISPATLKGSADGANVMLAWKFGFGGTAAQTLTATGDGKTATASIAPGTGFAYYTVGNNPAYDVSGFQMTVGPDGKLYYTALGPIVCSVSTNVCTTNDGAIGQFDPASGNATEIELHAEGIDPFFSSDGALWISGGPSGNLFRLPPATFSASALQTIAVPSPSPTLHPGSVAIRNLAEDAAKNVWFTDSSGRRVLKIPEAGPYASASITGYALPNGPAGTTMYRPAAQGIAYGADGFIYALDHNNGVLDKVNPSTGAIVAQLVTPQQTTYGANDMALPRFATTIGSKVYFTQSGGYETRYPFNGMVDSYDTSAATFTTLSLPSAYVGEPDGIASGAGLVYYADLINGIGLIDATSLKTRLYPNAVVGTQSQVSPNGVAVASDGSAYFTCYNGSVSPVPPLCIGHTVYVSNNWSVFPSSTIALNGVGTQSEQIMGIMESPSANSGPFSTTSSDPSTCTATSAGDHNFNIVGVKAGASCVITVTDAHGTSALVHVSVTQTTGSVQSTNRKGASL